MFDHEVTLCKRERFKLWGRTADSQRVRNQWETAMRFRSNRHTRSSLLAVTVACVIAVTACSATSAEDELRADMSEAGLSAESIECLVDAFDFTTIESLEGMVPRADAATAECVGEAFGEMFAGAFDAAFEDLATGEWESTDTEFPSRGDMEQLAEQCRGGDNAACDDLWLVSPIDSPEEALAESCGGRSTEPRMGSCEFHLE